jgi:hypothetical protein
VSHYAQLILIFKSCFSFLKVILCHNYLAYRYFIVWLSFLKNLSIKLLPGQKRPDHFFSPSVRIKASFALFEFQSGKKKHGLSSDKLFFVRFSGELRRFKIAYTMGSFLLLKQRFQPQGDLGVLVKENPRYPSASVFVSNKRVVYSGDQHLQEKVHFSDAHIGSPKRPSVLFLSITKITSFK